MLLTQRFNFFQDEIGNEGHVFVLTRCVKDTSNMYMSITDRDHIQDWSIARALSSVARDTVPYFLVHGGQHLHGLLVQTSIGRRKIFLCPCFPSGQPDTLDTTVREGNYGIGTLYSHQYCLTDERVAEEIKGQTFDQVLLRSTSECI